MRIAVPMTDGALCMHFGHCSTFALLDVENGKIGSVSEVVPPPHQPGLLPLWLSQQGVTLVISGGMGSRAQALFSKNGIKTVTGASGTTAEGIVNSYLAGTLQTGLNTCDH